MALNGGDLWWCGQNRCCEDYQGLVKRLGRVITDMLLSAPVGVVLGVTGLQPAVSLLNNRQQRYNLRLLAAPRTQPRKEILPVILCKGKEKGQLGEQPEDGDVWISASRARREGLGQGLVRAMEDGMNIDTSSGTEHTEWVELVEFLVNFAPFVSEKEEAAKDGKQKIDGPE